MTEITPSALSLAQIPVFDNTLSPYDPLPDFDTPRLNLTADAHLFTFPAITPLALVMRDAAGGAMVRPHTLGELLCWIHAGCTFAVCNGEGEAR